MSAYKDLLLDLPTRSMALLEAVSAQAISLELEATLVLMAASTVFVVPRERLLPTHPAGDISRVQDGIAGLNVELRKPFLSSRFVPHSYTEWRYGRISVYGKGPADWPQGDPLRNQESAHILAVVRNAVAHGNIATLEDPIENLLFFSEKREERNGSMQVVGYYYLSVPLAQFRDFLFQWLAYVNQLDTSYRAVLGSLSTAA